MCSSPNSYRPRRTCTSWLPSVPATPTSAAASQPKLAFHEDANDRPRV
jgi:hypothetical protein